MIEIDGSKGEGGGQILRTSLALSVITGKAFRLKNIRKNRPKPGLSHQHKACIDSMVLLSSSRAFGSDIGSDTLEFIPGDINKRTLDFDIGTAGSITLLTQCLLPALLMHTKPTRLNLKGGTDVAFSPSLDYFTNVFLRNLNADIRVSAKKRGYYPKGGGETTIEIKPRLPEVFDFSTDTELIAIKGISHCSSDLAQADVSLRQQKIASVMLNNKAGHVDIISQISDTYSSGSVITLWCLSRREERITSFGIDILGKKGISSETIGKECADKLTELIDSGTVIDEHCTDMLIPYMALSPGSKIRTNRITQHTRTNIEICEKFLDVVFSTEDNVICCRQTQLS